MHAMQNFVKRKFTLSDFVVLKTGLLCAGTLLGIYFVKPLKKLAPLLWFFSAGSFAYLLWRMVFNDEKG